MIGPYLLETVHLIDEGVNIQFIDQAAKDFGMVMGPVAMVDLIGLDICLAAVKNLGGTTPKILVDKVAKGELGKKSGKGFYTYKKGKIETQKGPATLTTVSANEVQDRLIFALINECVACLGEGIVASADEVDAGIIFGMGFAPFLGGPMQYAKTRGYKEIYEKLKSYEDVLGSRFSPKPGWDKLLKL